MAPSKLQPALLGGAFVGVLSALPIVSAGNFCCCLWLVLGGVLAAYVMQQNHPEPIGLADGAAVGFLAGLFGAVIYAVAAAVLVPMLQPLRDARLDRLFGDVPDVPPEFQGGIELSAPVIQERIAGGNAQITGNFTMEEAKDLSIVLKAGALPAPMKMLQNVTVGPSLGRDS